MKKILNFIDGSYVEGQEWFEKRSPLDNSVILETALADREAVDAAVLAAERALTGEWATLSVQERSAILYRVAEEIERRFDEFVEAEVADTGQPVGMTRGMNVPRGAANFRIFADLVKNIATECFDFQDGGAVALNYALRKPVGVVAVISPWNVPFLLTTWKVAPALACGNTVVVKPSEETPQSSALLGEVMNAAGVPKGVFNVVNGFGPNSTGECLTRHPKVNAITFTGETRTGEAIMQAAAAGARPVSFEMGGKNSAIVFADCNFEDAIQGITRSSFVNCGQVCLGTERVYVERPIFEKFVEALKAKAEALKPGDPFEGATSLGPLISQEHRNKVLACYRKAVEEGATVVTGGGIPEMPENLASGSWVQPTIWTGLTEQTATLQDEIFGPCCHIAPFDTEEEVLAKANDTPYGLGSSLWTTNISRAHRMAAQIDVGVVWVNSWFLRDLRTPFGGSGRSGIGREGGVHSIEFYTELKNVCVKI